MISGEKDTVQSGDDEDVIDVESFADSSLDDFPPYDQAAMRIAGVKAFLLPALVVLLAGAATIYFIGRSADGVQTTPAPQETASIDMPDFEPAAGDESLVPPQPAVNMNQPIPLLQQDGAVSEPAAPPADAPVSDTAANAAAPVDVPAPPADGAGVPESPSAADLTENAAQTPSLPPPDAQALGAMPPAETAGPEVTETNMPVPELPAAASSETQAVDSSAAVAPAASYPDVGASGSVPAAAEAEAAASAAAASGTTSTSAVTPSMPAGPDVYYDSTMNVPTGSMATAVGPRKLDPVQEPASKFVVVRKTHSGSSQESQIVAANRALKLGSYDAAAEMFEDLYKKNPRDARILMGRAVALQNTGRNESAIAAYEELLDIDTDNQDAMVNMLGLLRKQYPEVALRRLVNLYEKHPNNAGVAAQIGLTEADLGHLDDARRYLSIAASLEPNSGLHLYNRAVIEDRAGKREEAIRYYQEALESDAVYKGSQSVPREKIYDRLAVLRRM